MFSCQVTKHLRVAHGIGKVCPDCGKLFESDCTLNQHVKAIHQSKSRKSKTKSDLNARTAAHWQTKSKTGHMAILAMIRKS